MEQEKKQPDVRLIGLDLDGTTLTSDKVLTPHTKEVLEKCLAEGIQVLPATGRVKSGIPEYLTQIEGMRYVILSNGASVLDLKEDKVLYQNCIPWEGVFQKNFDGNLIPEKEKKYNGTGKYRPLTSFSEKRCYEEGTYTNWYKNGTEASNICGLTSTPNDNFLIAIATEGEKKGIIGNAAMHMPYIIIPGVNSFKKLFETRVGKNIIEKLRDNGTKYIAIAYDADKAKNINVLNAEKAFATEILNAGFGCIIVNWDAESGKGMDDAIINKSQFQFSEITKENIENYYCPWYANLEKG